MKKLFNMFLIAVLFVFTSTSVSAEEIIKGWGQSESGAISIGEFNISEDGTVTSTLGGGWHQTYNGKAEATDYTVKADIKWSETGSTADYPKYGLLVGYKDMNNHSAVFIDKKYNVLATFAKIGGQDTEWKNVDLPEDFDYSVAHELKVIKNGDQFDYYVDGEKLLTRNFAISNGEIGIITEDTKAEYSNITIEYPLPDTATKSYNVLLLGGLFIALGGVFFYSRRKVHV